jgi:hypothetical protein
MVESAKDFLLQSSEILREKLEGHKKSVNSLDIYHPSPQSSDGYLASAYKEPGRLMVSASDDGTALLWDL